MKKLSLKRTCNLGSIAMPVRGRTRTEPKPKFGSFYSRCEPLCLLRLSEGLERMQTSVTVSFIAHNQTYVQNYEQLIKM